MEVVPAFSLTPRSPALSRWSRVRWKAHPKSPSETPGCRNNMAGRGSCEVWQHKSAPVRPERQEVLQTPDPTANAKQARPCYLADTFANRTREKAAIDVPAGHARATANLAMTTTVAHRRPGAATEARSIGTATVAPSAG